jgi:hypothetical protein
MKEKLAFEAIERKEYHNSISFDRINIIDSVYEG